MYLNNKSNDDVIRSALIQAEVLAYTHINIKAGFDKAGIYPMVAEEDSINFKNVEWQ